MNTINTHKRGKSLRGFTIVEMIVVIAVFLFIIGAGIGIFISILQNQRRVLQEQQFLNQLSYAEEYMSKALRMAKTDRDGDGSCLQTRGRIYELTHHNINRGAFEGIKFINQSDNDTCQEFFLDVASSTDTTLVLWEKKGDNAPVALTSKNIKFDSENPIRFLINGLDSLSYAERCSEADLSQCVQPRVTILLNVKVASGNETRVIQTTVSRRNLNVLQ